jgi:chorismate dehydratase
MRKLRVSAISFLNTAPLMWDFDRGVPPGEAPVVSGDDPAANPLYRDFDVEYTVPSRCADALREGTADIGIVPVAAYASIPDLVVVPDVAIAAKGPVRSILLVSKVPLERTRTLAADTSSRTSVALAQVLYHLWFGRIPELVPLGPNLDHMLTRCDSALLIGDPALAVARSRYPTWDLAEEWERLTGKPFVFAFWAVRAASLGEGRPELDVAGVFRNSRDRGLCPASLSAIARCWAQRVHLSEAEVHRYLTQNIYYRLDEQTLPGLQLFYRYAAECGALPLAPPVRFVENLCR